MVQMPKYAVNFLKDYLKFVGYEYSFEDACREIIFDRIRSLKDSMKALPWHSSKLYERYGLLSIMDSAEEQREQLDLEEELATQH